MSRAGTGRSAQRPISTPAALTINPGRLTERGMDREDGTRSLSPRALKVLKGGLGGLGTVSLAGGLYWTSAHPLQGWTGVPLTFVGLGLALVALSLALDTLPARIGLPIGATLFTLLGALVLLSLLKIDPYRVIHGLRIRWFPVEVGIWRYDDRLGFANKPGAVGRHRKASFDVTYTIDDHGCRTTPNPENSKGDILCLGGSFTFGLGVEDDQAFPYLLGERYWTDYKVHNLSTTGWGTSHAYLNLLEWLEKRPPPRLVLYGWIPAHKTRNYIRSDWVRHLGRPWNTEESDFRTEDLRRHPHFEIEGGRLVFKGTVGAEDVDKDAPDLLAKEETITQAFIRETVSLCRDRGVPFVFLNMPVTGAERDELPQFVSIAIEESKANYLDCRTAYRGVLEGDGHPNAETYSALADLIASATIVNEALSSND